MKAYILNGARNVKDGWNGGENFNCQKPFFKSIFMSQFDPPTLSVAFSKLFNENCKSINQSINVNSYFSILYHDSYMITNQYSFV